MAMPRLEVDSNFKGNLFIVSHTHWDREWYQTFQQFRIRLVRMVDNLLDILERNQNFRYFTLDGQTIVLEDFLEARPEKREQLKDFIKNGRILIGPWYVLPDEFLEGPEAIIRNLMLGHRIAEEFGGVMKIGYLPDMFGHIGQMPQILNGFGIHEAVVWRGVGPEVDKNEFLWTSSDGSKVLTEYLRYGYGFGIRLPTAPERFKERMAFVVNQLSPYATTGTLLLTNGGDHQEAQPELPVLIEEFNKRSKDIKIIHGTIPMFFKSLKEYTPSLETYKGEFRSYGRAYLLPSVLSTRMWIKQLNFKCEYLLEKLAEPLTTWSWLVGLSSPEISKRAARLFSLCWLAWKYLIKNHPHDSICGCSVDEVHKDMIPRFEAAQEISKNVMRESAEIITEQIDTSKLHKDPSVEHHAIVVFNPADGPRTDVVDAELEFLEKPEDLLVKDESNIAKPCQILDVGEEEQYALRLDESRFKRLLPVIERGRLWGDLSRKGIIKVEGETAYVNLVTSKLGGVNVEEAHRIFMEVKELLGKNIKNFIVKVTRILVKFIFIAENVPAYGYKTYIVESHGCEKKTQMSSTSNTLENEYYRVEIDPHHGTVFIYDKELKRLFQNGNHFVDGGDDGDEYNYSPPHFDKLISEPFGSPHITLVEDGPIRSTFEISMVYKLPLGLTEDRASRSSETRNVPIISYVSLYLNIKRIEFKTIVDNKVNDHRLRVVFPTEIDVEHLSTEGHFDVVERPISTELNGELIEYPLRTYPQRSFVDVNNGKSGLMLSNRGLPECEGIHGEKGVDLALTLFRSVGWLSRPDFKSRDWACGPIIKTPEAQCIGKHTFEYAVISHSERWESAFKQAHFFNYPLWAFETDFHEGALPLEQNWIRIEPSSNLILSAVKIAEDRNGIIVRFYNIGEEEVNGRIKLSQPFSEIYLVNLNEELISKLGADENGWLNLKVPEKKILTIKFNF